MDLQLHIFGRTSTILGSDCTFITSTNTKEQEPIIHVRHIQRQI